MPAPALSAAEGPAGLWAVGRACYSCTATPLLGTVRNVAYVPRWELGARFLICSFRCAGHSYVEAVELRWLACGTYDSERRTLNEE